MDSVPRVSKPCPGQQQEALEGSEAGSFQRKAWEISQDQTLREPTTYSQEAKSHINSQ